MEPIGADTGVQKREVEPEEPLREASLPQASGGKWLEELLPQRFPSQADNATKSEEHLPRVLLPLPDRGMKAEEHLPRVLLPLPDRGMKAEEHLPRVLLPLPDRGTKVEEHLPRVLLPWSDRGTKSGEHLSRVLLPSPDRETNPEERLLKLFPSPSERAAAQMEERLLVRFPTLQNGGILSGDPLPRTFPFFQDSRSRLEDPLKLRFPSLDDGIRSEERLPRLFSSQGDGGMRSEDRIQLRFQSLEHREPQSRERLPQRQERLTLSRPVAADNRQDDRLLVRLGFPPCMVGDLSLTRNLTEIFATNEDTAFFSDFDHLAKRAGAPKLSDSQKLAITRLNDDQKEMFRLTLSRLNELADGKADPAQYMANVMRDAAQLADKYGRAPDSWNYLKSERQYLFADYVGMVMSQESHGILSDMIRVPASGGTDHTGSALEVLSKSIIGKNADKGFNPNIIDDENTSSTVTHHFREFLELGYLHGWQGIGNVAARINDDPGKNPGDVRNAYYATMLGVALAWGTISPKEAAGMTDWAFTKHGGTQPPWGSKAEKGEWLDTEQYDINVWLKAYRNKVEN